MCTDTTKRKHNFSPVLKITVFAPSCPFSDCNNSESTVRNVVKFNIRYLSKVCGDKSSSLVILQVCREFYKMHTFIYNNIT